MAKKPDKKEKEEKYEKNIKKHLKHDIKEAKTGISRDKKLMKKV